MSDPTKVASIAASFRRSKSKIDPNIGLSGAGNEQKRSQIYYPLNDTTHYLLQLTGI
jgi:hypothetical protein